MSSHAHLGELVSPHIPEPVGWAALTPPDYDRGTTPPPLCILLMGGGGTRQHLIDCQPLFEAWWKDGSVAPLVIATPTGGMSYFHGPWEDFITGDLLRHLRSRFRLGTEREATAVAGISMGGYGALKIAFADPGLFGAVAAIHPLLEPALRESDVPARNRLHHGAGGPRELIGANRSAEAVEANNPANRARSHADEIRRTGLAIYFDVGDNDFINAQDGAEFLHRVLWDLDVSHEYRLIRGGDHGGPTFLPRLHDAFVWLTKTLAELRTREDDPAIEPAANAPPGSREFLRLMRRQLSAVREGAAASDPTANQRFGALPGCQ